MSSIRPASHAGSWYTEDSDKLTSQIETVLAKNPEYPQLARFGVSPHAGYRFCLDVGVDVYKHLQNVSNITVLAPLHRIYSEVPLTTTFDELETPLGNLAVNKPLVEELLSTGACEYMVSEADILEHSFEMQLPLIKYFLPNAKVTPVFLGEANRALMNVIKSKLESEDHAFIISSDFCHYGSNFRFTPFSAPAISAQIEQMDREGMAAINKGHSDFVKYLKKTKNTICGRYPLLFLLECFASSSSSPKFQWTMYKQSSKVQTNSDFSVSYAAGTC